MERVWAGDVHAVTDAAVAVRSCRDEHGVDLTVGAMSVVAAQVAGVGSGLIKVGLLGLGLALEFKDDDRAVDEEDDIGPTRFERELVLQDGRVLVGELVDLHDLADLVPGS